MKDPRIAEFTARIDEAQSYYDLAVKQNNENIIKKLGCNIEIMKQQRKDIIDGRI